MTRTIKEKRKKMAGRNTKIQKKTGTMANRKSLTEPGSLRAGT
jgi:hypothetical protein